MAKRFSKNMVRRLVSGDNVAVSVALGRTQLAKMTDFINASSVIPIGGSLLSVNKAGSYQRISASGRTQPLYVVISLDLTGSMGADIQAAKEAIKTVFSTILAEFGGVFFALVSHMDYALRFTTPDLPGYPGTGYDDMPYGSVFGDYPWRLDQDFTQDVSLLEAVVDGLEDGSGADFPESYLRVMYETLQMDFPSGVQKVLLMLGDDVPHDYIYNTGVDPGRDEIIGTSDDLRLVDFDNALGLEPLDMITLMPQFRAQKINIYAVNYGTTSVNGDDYGFWHTISEGGSFNNLASQFPPKFPVTLSDEGTDGFYFEGGDNIANDLLDALRTAILNPTR